MFLRAQPIPAGREGYRKNFKMILSFHPNIVADRNILCAGRLPNDKDRAAISRAKAVILPQSPTEDLYRMCRKHCTHVFPNYDVRFDYPRKIGQARLFQQKGVPFPLTYAFDEFSAFRTLQGETSPLGFPCVFKSDWGGEGEQVFLLETGQFLEERLEWVKNLEQGGQKGFLLQEYVPHGGRSLRVVIVGDQLLSYWRLQQDSSHFLTNLKTGAVIDHDFEPRLQEAGKATVGDFCSETGINLAGFDLLFSEDGKVPSPLFLEINYFFGRKGLGGSAKYYELVDKAVACWLEGIGLSL